MSILCLCCSSCIGLRCLSRKVSLSVLSLCCKTLSQPKKGWWLCTPSARWWNTLGEGKGRGGEGRGKLCVVAVRVAMFISTTHNCDRPAYLT